jgi:hypothetical protein
MNPLLDPRRFVPQMGIANRQGEHVTLGQGGLFQSQIEFLETYQTHKRILCLKARQLGITTVTTLALTHEALFCPHEFNVLTMTHEAEAMGRVNSMIRHAVDHLPGPLRPQFTADNMRSLGFKHNGSHMRQLMAGGRSQGRAFTYQAVHATEMGLWPRGSSAREGNSVDEETWNSVMATLHGDSRIIIESTAHGPAGVFAKMCRVAQESDDWAFLFFPWFNDPTYMRAVPYDFELKDDEAEMMKLHNLTLEQISWRRFKLEDQGYSLRQFRQEYPSTPEDPFLVSEGMWFDTDGLNDLLALLPKDAWKSKEGWRWFKQPNRQDKYFVGVDPSGGVGGDQGVIQIINDRLDQIAIYASRHTAPSELGREAAKAAAKCGGATVLIERNNKNGQACLEAAQRAGARIWKQNGKTWFTGTWSNKSTKTMLYDHARDLINNGMVILRDPMTIQELITIREKPDGNIEADGEFSDDRADALCLALMCGKRHILRAIRDGGKKALSEQRAKRHQQLGLR